VLSQKEWDAIRKCFIEADRLTSEHLKTFIESRLSEEKAAINARYEALAAEAKRTADETFTTDSGAAFRS